MRQGVNMKKTIMFLIFSFIICVLAFPTEEGWGSEVWISVGYEFGYFTDEYIDQGNKIETATYSNGINISSYNFYKNRFGIFVHGSFLIPKNTWVWDRRGMSKIDLSTYSYNMDTGLILGFVYKIDFTNDFKSYFGIGFNWLSNTALYSGFADRSFSRETNNLGIGGDIGLKIDISDRFFLQLGSIITYDYARHKVIKTYRGTSLTDTSSEWNQNYMMFSARPYFAAGLNLFWRSDNDRLRLSTGKPN
jgi:hypothetical protein